MPFKNDNTKITHHAVSCKKKDGVNGDVVSMGTVLCDNPEKRVVTENRPTLDTEPSHT